MPDNDLQIADRRLSGKHCRILRKFEGDGKMIVVLEDSSTNGTYLNGAIVSLSRCQMLIESYAFSLHFELTGRFDLFMILDRKRELQGTQERR